MWRFPVPTPIMNPNTDSIPVKDAFQPFKPETGQLKWKLSLPRGFEFPRPQEQRDSASHQSPRSCKRGWALTSGISRLLFTLGPESGWPSLLGCFRLLDSWRVVKALSRGCFSEDLELTEQSSAASSASVSTFTVLIFRTAAEKRERAQRERPLGCWETSRAAWVTGRPHTALWHYHSDKSRVTIKLGLPSKQFLSYHTSAIQ